MQKGHSDDESDYFNPRSPHGERQFKNVFLAKGDVFQSTLPAWGATRDPCTCGGYHKFQSTLPAWGATKYIPSYGIDP